jgi:hypothetical protein
MGKLSATPASILRKYALTLRIATSTALRLLQPGGTISSWYWLLVIYFVASETSLSITYLFGSMLACFRRSIIVWYACITLVVFNSS